MPVAAQVAQLSPLQFVVAIAIAAAFSMLVFWHAERHGSKHATAWGIATFLFLGVALPVYFARHWLRTRARR